MALSQADLPELLNLLNQIDIRVKMRRKTAAQWVTSNEVLLEGEVGLEKDTGRFKWGDGATAWNSLGYYSDSVPSFTYTIDTSSTSDTDPGSGKLRFNSGTQNSATRLFFDDAEADTAIDLSALYGEFALNGPTGLVHIVSASGTFKIYKWSAVEDGTGYFKFTVSLLVSSGNFANGVKVRVLFHPYSAGGTSGGGSTGSQTALSAAILALSPSLYYKCDEPAGSATLADSSGNGMDLTIYGSCVLNQCALVPGGGCFISPTSSTSANGAKRTGSSGLSVPINYDYTQFCVAMHISSTGAPILIFEIGASGETTATNVQAELLLDNVSSGYRGLTAFWEHASGADDNVAGPVVPVGVPFAIAVRKNSTTKKVDFFINGRWVYTNVYANKPTGGTSGDTYLGGSPSGSIAYCMVSNFAFFPSLLTDAQIANLASKAGLTA